MTQKEIAEKYGVTQKVVWAAMRRFGIKARKAAKRDQRGTKNASWASDNPQAKSEAQRLIWRVVQFVWINGELAAASPKLYRERLCDLVPAMPREAAHNGWLLGSRLKEKEELCGLWHRVYAAPFKEALDMLPELLERVRQTKRPEEVASRVDRLRGLGNAIVPQISEWIGRRIVEAEKRESTA